MCRVYQMPTFYLYRQHLSPDEEGGLCPETLNLLCPSVVCNKDLLDSHVIFGPLILLTFFIAGKAMYHSGGPTFANHQHSNIKICKQEPGRTPEESEKTA